MNSSCASFYTKLFDFNSLKLQNQNKGHLFVTYQSYYRLLKIYSSNQDKHDPSPKHFVYPTNVSTTTPIQSMLNSNYFWYNHVSTFCNNKLFNMSEKFVLSILPLGFFLIQDGFL